MYPVRLTQQTPEEVVAQSTLNEQVEKFERKLVEQQYKDKEQRQSEQIKMHIQLKDFETQLYQQQKRDFEFTQREHQQIIQQVRDYQQKLVCGQTGSTTLVAGGIVNGPTQIQTQVKDFERMLVEKQQQEIDRRTRVHFHLVQKLKEFERLLCEQQQMEFEHLIRKKDQLKTIGGLVMGTTGVTGGICGTGVTGGMWAEKQQILDQQTTEEKVLKNKQEKLVKFVKEIESELNNRDIEQSKREVNGHLKTQQIIENVQNSQINQLYNCEGITGVNGVTGITGITGITGLTGGFTGKYNTIPFTGAKQEQIQMLEQQLYEYKRILREKLRESTPFGVQTPFVAQTPFGVPTTTPFGVNGQFCEPMVGGMIKEKIEEVYTIEWIKEIVQKLRELECQLIQHGIQCWAEKKMHTLRTHIGFLDQIELPAQNYQCHQTLMKLRDLLDYELPVEIRPIGPTTSITRQLCNELVRLVEDKIRFNGSVVPSGEFCGVSGLPVDRLWQKLRTIDYKLRELRSGEYEPHWSNIYKRMNVLEQVFQQPQYFQFNVCGNGIPITQKMETIQEHIQQLEWLVQETVFVHRQVPFKYQALKHYQQKQVVRKLIQLIDEVECQMQSQLTVVGGSIPTTPIHYQAQMICRQLKGLKCQLKCLLHQQNLVVLHHKMQQMLFEYERQLPREMIENKIHQVQFSNVMQLLKCLEQQLVEQHLQGYQTYQQTPTWFNVMNGGQFLCIEDIFEHIKNQFICQKQLQQCIREYITLLVQHKNVMPTILRQQVYGMIMPYIRDFESLINQSNEVFVDQEKYFGEFPTCQIPQYFVQQYTTQHSQFQTLFKQLTQVLTGVSTMGVPQYFPYQQQQQLVNGLIQQIQNIQMQHQQLINYQQYPAQFLWTIEQQQKPCFRRLTQYLQQIQQLQYLPVSDVLPQQQQYILFKQIQQQLQFLNQIQQQHLRSKLWKNWSNWTQTNIPVLSNHLQYFKQQQVQIRILQQQLQEFATQKIVSSVYGPTIRQQMIKSISQPTLLENQMIDECYEPTYGMDGNNNNYSSWCLVEPESCGDDFIVNFFTGKEVEQEKIVSDLVQRYIEGINVPSEINNEFRRKFETLYFENNKLGQFLRSRVNEVAQLRKQFEEIQATRGFTNKYGVPTYKSFRSVTPTTYGVMGGCGVSTFEQYESLPTPFGCEETYNNMPEYYTNKPSWRSVDTMLNSLENKLTQLKLENGESFYPSESVYGIRNGLNTIPYGISSVYYPETTVPTVKQTVEVSKTQTLPNGQQMTQTFSECKICPVCGIAVEKELAQPEFELHVNSHFPFSE